MKKLMFVIIAVFSSLMFSCSESTVNPNDSKEQKEINLTKNVWVFSSSTTTKLPATTKFKFEKDGKLYGLKESEWNTGTWSFDYNSNLLILGGLTDVDSTTLVSVNDNKLVLKVTIENVVTELTYIPEVLEISKLTITGNITFDPGMSNQDLTGAKICILWFTPNYDKYMTVYGIGTIDKNNKTFSIQADNSFPMSLFMVSTSKIDGYFNMGYICLIWDETLQNGQRLHWNEYLDNLPKLGCIEDRAILFVNGNYKNWTLDFLQGDFNQGYNFCKGWYNTQLGQNDKWQVDGNISPLYIKVLPNGKINDFKFPNWQ